jgi:hypothetical protein
MPEEAAKKIEKTWTTKTIETHFNKTISKDPIAFTITAERSFNKKMKLLFNVPDFKSGGPQGNNQINIGSYAYIFMHGSFAIEQSHTSLNHANIILYDVNIEPAHTKRNVIFTLLLKDENVQNEFELMKKMMGFI